MNFDKLILHLLFHYFCKMEIIILLIVGLLLFLGILGAVLPVLPGPLLSYSGLLVYHLCIHNLPANLILFISIAVFFISALDYFLQIYGVKYAGGGKYAIRGSLVGLLLGIIFFPPFGILLGAFFGAFIGAKMEMNKNAVEIAFGALWGYIIGTAFKLSISIYIVYIIFFL